MYFGKKLTILLTAVFIVAASSGWAFNFWKARQNTAVVSNQELSILQNAFVQQYGDKAVIKQVVSPNRVFAALWTDENNVTHVSWNIGGIWTTVYNAPTAIK